MWNGRLICFVKCSDSRVGRGHLGHLGHLGGPAGDPSLLTAHSSTHCGPKSSHCGPEGSAKLHFITLHCALDLLLPEELGVWLEVAGEQCVVQFIGFHEYKMLAATSPGEKRAGQGGGKIWISDTLYNQPPPRDNQPPQAQYPITAPSPPILLPFPHTKQI